jgi:hypothetical protein
MDDVKTPNDAQACLVLRVARTLADLEGREAVVRLDVAEALSYRQSLMNFSCSTIMNENNTIRVIV